MSRCFGDLVGRRLGLITRPDIMSHKINDDDRYIIIASDGIWEWMENEQVSKKLLESSEIKVEE